MEVSVTPDSLSQIESVAPVKAKGRPLEKPINRIASMRRSA